MPQAFKDLKALQVSLVQLALRKALLVSLERLDRWVCKEVRALLGLQVFKELMARLVYKEFKEALVSLVLLVRLELLVCRVFRVLME